MMLCYTKEQRLDAWSSQPQGSQTPLTDTLLTPNLGHGTFMSDGQVPLLQLTVDRKL